MGLSISRHMQKFPPNWLKRGVKKLYVGIQKDFSHVKNEAGFLKDVTLIDLESLQEIISNMNFRLVSCSHGQNEKVLFGLHVDETHILWKATAQIICFKVNIVTKAITIVNFMDVVQFWRLRAELINEIGLKRLLDEQNSDEGGFEIVNKEDCMEHSQHLSNDENIEELNICCQLTTSTVIQRIDEIKDQEDSREECLICMDSKCEVSLPCAHSFCEECISRWNIVNNTCPVCRDQVSNKDEFWEFTDIPDQKLFYRNLLEIAASGNS